jgi:hypothetical protein
LYEKVKFSLAGILGGLNGMILLIIKWGDNINDQALFNTPVQI